MVWVKKELKDHLVLTLLQWEESSPTGPGCLECIQPGLKHLQRRGIHICTAQHTLVPHHPHSIEFLPNIQSKSTLFQFKAIPSYTISTRLWEKSLSSFLVDSLQIVDSCKSSKDKQVISYIRVTRLSLQQKPSHLLYMAQWEKTHMIPTVLSDCGKLKVHRIELLHN